MTRNGTDGRVYGGDACLVHIADGTRKEVGQKVANFINNKMRDAAFMRSDRSQEAMGAAYNNPLCPGCYMIALFNAAIALAERNGQPLTELGKTMSAAFAKLAANPASGLTEEIEVILDND